MTPAAGQPHSTSRTGGRVPAIRPRLLVVDDDPEVRNMLVRFLEAEAYEVDSAANGAEALATIRARSPELVILDVNLEDENGFSLLPEIKESGEVAVILLSGRGAEADRVVGLRLGGDDYVVKPFSPAELAARVEAVLRRKAPRPNVENALLRFGELDIDPMAREVRVTGESVEMTAKEFDLLLFLARSPRQVFSRDELLAGVWFSSTEWQDPGTVTEHVRRLRRKIELDADDPKFIRTIRGVGYRFEPST